MGEKAHAGKFLQIIDVMNAAIMNKDVTHNPNEIKQKLKERWEEEGTYEDNKKFLKIFNYTKTVQLLKHSKYFFILASEKLNNEEFYKLLAGKSTKWG